jgi:glycosyltransferase involved in cell wall biosynthesis
VTSDASDDGPVFSVIVPTYDRPELLAQAVASVLDQTIGDLECIVVDDGGTLPPQLPIDARIRVIHRATSGGAAAARNTGLDEARGRYVSFLDDDDVYVPNRLELSLEALGRTPVVVCHRNGGHRDLDGDVTDTILDHLVPHLGQVCLVRTLTPRFDERFLGSEDVEWWLRVAGTLAVTTVPQVGYLYRSHTGRRHANGLRARVEGTLRLLQLHSSYFATHPTARSFQWKQIGLAHLRLGECASARAAFARSLVAKPESRTAWHLLRSVVISARRAAPAGRRSPTVHKT